MTDAPPITLLVNPVAGKGKSGKNYSIAVQSFMQIGLDCDVIVSEYPGHITQVSSELAALSKPVVVACGGDGTINEIANGIVGTETALGVIPLGCSNNFAQAMGIPLAMEAACRVIADGHLINTDLIKVNHDKLVCNGGFVGFESEVAAFTRLKRAKRPHADSISKIRSLLKVLSFQSKTVELRFNDTRHYGEYLLVVVENGHPYQKETSPVSVHKDGEPVLEPHLHIGMVESVPQWRFFSRLAALYKQKKPNKQGVTWHQTSAVHVQSLGPLGFYSDGEFITKTPFRLEIMPQRLNVFVPMNR